MANRGRKRRRRRTGGYPDLTSFSDIAFLLIIYFILLTSFYQPQGLRTDLPAGKPTQQARADEKTITVETNAIRYGAKVVSIEQLRAELIGLDLPSLPAERRVVQMEAKSGVRWQAYYEVLAAISGAGGEPGIVMEVGEEGP